MAGGQGLSPKTPPSSQAAYLAGLASLQVSLQLHAPCLYCSFDLHLHLMMLCWGAQHGFL